tara:strand:+ start:100 stop:315 length:216 start_codon:yes stop_codon:yes gene_type:complete
MTDQRIYVQDRLWGAHFAAHCPEMKTMWLAKIREYQRKQGVDNGEFFDADGGIRRSAGGDLILFDSKRGVR